MARTIHSAEEVKKRLDSLPQEVKNLLYSWEMTSAITEVGKRQQLHFDQMDTLNALTGQVMLGFVDVKDFPANLVESLSIERIKADAVAQDINDTLFSKIRDSMKKVYEANKTEPALIVPPTPPASAVSPAASSTPSAPLQPLASVLPKTPPVAPPAAPAPAPQSTPPVTTIMPPAAKPPAPPAPAVSVPPAPPKPPVSAPDMHPADVMLNEKTVQVAPVAKPEPPKPGIYKADPYREPPE